MENKHWSSWCLHTNTFWSAMLGGWGPSKKGMSPWIHGAMCGFYAHPHCTCAPHILVNLCLLQVVWSFKLAFTHVSWEHDASASLHWTDISTYNHALTLTFFFNTKAMIKPQFCTMGVLFHSTCFEFLELLKRVRGRVSAISLFPALPVQQVLLLLKRLQPQAAPRTNRFWGDSK